jgi:hypothetical protein
MRKARKTLVILTAAAVLFAGAALGASIASGSGTRTESDTTTVVQTEPTTQPVNDANLELIAQAAAARYGEREPTQLVAVTGAQNGSAITTLTGAVVENAGDGVVDVVQEHGNFTDPTTPYGQTPPTGHSLTVVISRETGEATDIYMIEGDAPGPDLANLGRGTPAPLQ